MAERQESNALHRGQISGLRQIDSSIRDAYVSYEMYDKSEDYRGVHVSVSRARDDFAGLVNRAAYQHDRVLIARRGKPIAAIVPMEDVEALEELEDEFDRRAVEEALAEGGEPIPWEQVEKELLRRDR
jgi:prevent-host-death family protein